MSSDSCLISEYFCNYLNLQKIQYPEIIISSLKKVVIQVHKLCDTKNGKIWYNYDITCKNEQCPFFCMKYFCSLINSKILIILVI